MQLETFISRELLHENPSSLRLIISFLQLIAHSIIELFSRECCAVQQLQIAPPQSYYALMELWMPLEAAYLTAQPFVLRTQLSF
jgi:hypothetical protein